MAKSLSPWRADVDHREKLQVERQGRLIQDRRQEIYEIYKSFVHSEITVEEVCVQLQSLQIQPPRLFIALLNQNRACSEVPFVEFTRNLSAYDPRESAQDSEPAGAPHHSLRPSMLSVKDSDVGLFECRRRINKRILLDQKTKAMELPRPGIKLVVDIDDTGGYLRNKSSAAMKKVVFTDESAPALLSHSQLDLQTGLHGNEVELGYNSEQRLLREQILAAMRRLDAGDISLAEFQDKVFNMGFEVLDRDGSQLKLSLLKLCYSYPISHPMPLSPFPFDSSLKKF
jgi:hypothetical protein